MEIKNLLNKLKTKPELPEHFFAVEINQDSVLTAVWTVIDGQTKVVKLGSTEFWDGSDKNSLLKAVDASVSNASSNLETEPSGAIFGLPESWLSKEKISPDKKSLLKFICQELDLNPLGFVITNTALIQYLRLTEGTPPSAVFIQMDSGELNITLVKLGKIIGTQLVGRSEDLGADVEEGLSRFKTVDSLPSRMILFDGQTDFEEAKQQLTSYDWEEKLPFMHFPKVETLKPQTSIKAVSLSGGSEVAKSLGFDIKSSQPAADDSHQPTASDLGFVINQDIADSLKTFQKSSSDIQTDQPETAQPETVEPDITHSDSNQPETKPSSDQKATALKVSPVSNFASSIFSKLKKLKTTLLLPFKKLAHTNKLSRLIVLIFSGFLVLFITLFTLYWRLPKAELTIFVEPNSIKQEITLTIDPQKKEPDLDTLIMPGELIEISIEGQDSLATTGIKRIGDPAQGEVEILNKTDSSKTFSAGTVLIADNNLAFTLDEDTTVASSSSYEDENDNTIITPGKSQAAITAQSIGEEGNLQASEKLDFKQFSPDSYQAKVIDGLSGGSSQEVKIVASEDLSDLTAKLTQKLNSQAEQELSQQLGEEKKVIGFEDDQTLTDQQFSHQVDDQTDTLQLSAKLEFTGLSYQKSHLSLLTKTAIQDKIPNDFQLHSQDDQIEIISQQKLNDQQLELTINYQASLIPRLDFDKLKKDLAGKYPRLVEEYLSSIPNFVEANIKITPNLPEKIKTFPRVKKNLIITLQTI